MLVLNLLKRLKSAADSCDIIVLVFIIEKWNC